MKYGLLTRKKWPAGDEFKFHQERHIWWGEAARPYCRHAQTRRPHEPHPQKSQFCTLKLNIVAPRLVGEKELFLFSAGIKLHPFLSTFSFFYGQITPFLLVV
jgi:hypothetical protein